MISKTRFPHLTHFARPHDGVCPLLATPGREMQWDQPVRSAGRAGWHGWHGWQGVAR